VCGLSQGAPLAVLYALAYPERVRALILMEGVCCDAADPYKPLSDDNTLFDWSRTLAEFDADYEGWCKSRVKLIEPHCKPVELDLSVEYMQATASPAAHRFIWCCLMGFDIRPMLRHVTQPTLVIHTTEDKLYPVKHGRYLAEHIPGAQYVELESDCHMPMYDKNVAPQMFDSISGFIEKLPDWNAPELSERFVSTILFTDIVSSTDQQRTHGDSVWTKKISEFEERSAAIVESCRGKLAGSTGDGIFASFDVPGDGLKAACLLIEDAHKNNHPIRAGIHTGEVQRSRNGLHGLAVTLAARVADQAGKDEVLVTNVTQGIVEGGDFEFIDCGEVELKGLGSRRLARLVR
jgi:class 3 adenylate cyclase